jgi:hypothetical protein
MANETHRENNAQPTTRESVASQTRLDSSSTAQPTRRDTVTRTPVEGGLRVQVPQNLRDRFKILKQLPTQGAEADILLADDLQHQRNVIIKLYRHGIEPKSEVLAKIAAMPAEHIVQLYEHGQMDGVWYEVMECAKYGSLRDLIKKPISPEQAKSILKELHAALNELHQHQIIHRDLKPENILVRELSPLNLMLTDFGIASVNVATQHLTNTSRTAKYAAPEAASGVLSAKADWWSLGIILLEVLTGKTPFDGMSDAVITKHLMTHPLTPDGVTDSHWRQLLLGLLNRNDSVRWGGAEIGRWLAGENVAVSEDQETVFTTSNQTHASGQYRPYVFAGASYATPKALAAGLVQHWDDAVKHLSRDLILQWFREEIKDQDAISFLMDLKEERELSGDIKLLRLVQRLDPSLPPIWKGMDVSVDGILAMANAAQNDAKQRDWLWEFRRDGWQAFPQPELQDFNQKLTVLVQQFELAWEKMQKAWKKHSSSGNFPQLTKPDMKIVVPQLVTHLFNQNRVGELRKMLRQAHYATLIEQCPWYGALGNQESVDFPSMLLLVGLAKEAQKWIDTEISRIRQSLNSNKSISKVLKECPWFIALGRIESAGFSVLKRMEILIDEAVKWCDIKQKIVQEMQNIRESITQENQSEFAKLFPWFMELSLENINSQSFDGLVALTQKIKDLKEWIGEQERLREISRNKRNEELARLRYQEEARENHYRLIFNIVFNSIIIIAFLFGIGWLIKYTYQSIYIPIQDQIVSTYKEMSKSSDEKTKEHIKNAHAKAIEAQRLAIIEAQKAEEAVRLADVAIMGGKTNTYGDFIYGLEYTGDYKVDKEGNLYPDGYGGIERRTGGFDYKGQFKLGKPDGYGISWEDGRIFEFRGKFLEQMKEGFGIALYSGGDRFEGYLCGLYGCRESIEYDYYGVYTLKNGDHLIGEFDSIPSYSKFFGVYIMSNGKSWEGFFTPDKIKQLNEGPKVTLQPKI